jgi:hypothetical protein
MLLYFNDVYGDYTLYPVVHVKLINTLCGQKM